MRLVRALLIALAVACVLPAQQYAHLSGLVRDPSGAAVPEASVTVVSQDTGFRRSAGTQAGGWYGVSSLQPGRYKITIRKEGFRTVIRFGVELDAAQRVRVDFTLPLGSVHEVIEVNGSPDGISSEDASIGTVVGRDRIEKLPLNGRGLVSLLELAPGSIATPATRGEAGQFTVNGQRPNMNYFVVDGVSANTGVSGGGLPAQSTGGALPGMTALGSLHGLISLDALAEFHIQTSSASPEFGRLPGAQVLMSSRSGSNEFHGALSYYARSASLNANNWFANRNATPADPPSMRDFGGAIGGPIRKNRTFFFLSYEGMRLEEPFAWQSPTPSLDLRAQAPDWTHDVLALFPLPNGPELGGGLAEWRGIFRRRSRFDVGSLRLDHAVNSRLTVFARYSGAFSSNEFSRIQVNDLRIRSGSLTMGASMALGSASILDLKVNHSSSAGRSTWREPGGSSCFLSSLSQYLFRSDDYCGALFRFSIAGIGQAAAGPEPDQRQGQWHFLPSAGISIRTHQIRLGLDYRYYTPERIDRAPSLGLISENLAELTGSPNLWIATAAPQAIRSSLGEFSAFAQDTWRIHPRLTATFGVRWEYAQAPNLTTPDGTPLPLPAYGFDGQTQIWQGRIGNFAPRAGLAFRPFRDNRTVVRAGWGLFFDSSLSIATDLINGGPFSATRFRNSRNAPFSTLLSYGFAPGLRLPAVHQWNVSVERALRAGDVLSIAYAGSSGQHLLRREYGPYANSQTLFLALATNHGQSVYHGLQLQYRRPLVRGVQALASYSWAHSIDNSSSDSMLQWAASGFTPSLDRGSSDFDVRQNLSLALTFEPGRRPGSSLADRLLSNWGIDTIFRARSGFPITPLTSEYTQGLGFANAFRPDRILGQPIWVGDASAPGGRRLNPAAFALTAGQRQGTLGRNSIAGFGMHQVDLALRRQLALPGERSLLLRLEAFNLFNHPNFADPLRYLSSPLFGQSPSMLNFMLGTGSPGSGLSPSLQTGGSRSVQLVLRFQF